jgi:hypothetical protein
VYDRAIAAVTPPFFRDFLPTSNFTSLDHHSTSPSLPGAVTIPSLFAHRPLPRHIASRLAHTIKQFFTSPLAPLPDFNHEHFRSFPVPSPNAAYISFRYTPTMADLSTKPLSPIVSSDFDMMNPSKGVDTQDACPLFDLAVELRNEIYSLVFAVETKEEDGSIVLDKSTAPPSKALTMTCQVIRSETRAIYKAAYHAFPEHLFTLDVIDRRRRPFVPNLGDDVFSRIKTIDVTWQADERKERKEFEPLHFTTHFTRTDGPPGWKIRVEMHNDIYCAREARQVISHLEECGLKGLAKTQPCAWASGEEMLSYGFSCGVQNVLYPCIGEANGTWR